MAQEHPELTKVGEEGTAGELAGGMVTYTLCTHLEDDYCASTQGLSLVVDGPRFGISGR